MYEHALAADGFRGRVRVRVSGGGLPDTCAALELTYLSSRASVRVPLVCADTISASFTGLFDMGGTTEADPVAWDKGACFSRSFTSHAQVVYVHIISDSWTVFVIEGSKPSGAGLERK